MTQEVKRRWIGRERQIDRLVSIFGAYLLRRSPRGAFSTHGGSVEAARVLFARCTCLSLCTHA